MDKFTYTRQREAENKARSLSRRLEQLQRFRHQYYQTDKDSFPYRNLADFFHSQRAPLQSFVIDNEVDSKIIGDQDTTISLQKNSLLHIDNQAVKGAINIQLREVRTKADMIFSDLPSTSEDRLLETAGAFYLDINQSYLPLRLQQPLKVSLPISPAISNPVALRLYHGQQITSPPHATVQTSWQTMPNAHPSLQRQAGINFVKLQLHELHWNSAAYLFRSSGAQRSMLHIRPQLPHDEVNEIRTYLVFKTINCVARMYAHRGQFSLYNVPTDLPFEVIAIGKSSQAFYYAQLALQHNGNQIHQLPLQAIKEEELLRQVNAL